MVETAAPTTKGQTHLMTQDAKTVDPTRLTALTPEVVSCVVVACMISIPFLLRHRPHRPHPPFVYFLLARLIFTHPYSLAYIDELILLLTNQPTNFHRLVDRRPSTWGL